MTYEPAMPATTDVLATFDDDDEPGRRPAPWILVAGAAALVLALVAGVTYGLRTLSGGGTQPEDVLPAGAIVFGKVDLDPPAGQKVDGFRFLRQFPALEDKLSGDDLRKVVFDAVASDAGWDDVDYATQVEPWLGQRLAVAAYPQGTLSTERHGQTRFALPDMVVALQVTDPDKARQGLELLAQSGGARGEADRPGGHVGFVVEGEYAFLAETRESAQKAVSLAEAGSLATSRDFAADMASMDGGFASVWMDMARAGSVLNPLMLGAVGSTGSIGTLTGGSGRAAYVARFDGPDAIEVVGRFTDADELAGVAPATLQGMSDLPASTVAAFGLAGGDQLVAPMWKGLREQVEAMGADFDEAVTEAERSLGVDLPADLETMLGSNLLAALDGAGLDDGVYEAGVRTTTDPVRAAALMTRLNAALAQAEPDLRAEAIDDGYVLASSPAMVARLTAASGSSLGESASFRRALPDVDQARMALWLDVKPLVRSLSGMFDGKEEPLDPNVEPLAGLGVTVSTDGDNGGSFRLRLVTEE